MLTGTFAELHAAGCIQTGSDVEGNAQIAEGRFGLIFHALMAATGGNPCAECPIVSKCRARAEFFRIDDNPLQDIFNESLRSITSGLGITQARSRQLEVAKIRHRQGSLYHPRRLPKEQKSFRQTCPRCGCKIRGENHEEHCKARKGE